MPDAATFLRLAGGFLEQQQAVRNLAYGTARHCVDDPGRYGDAPLYFAVVHREGTVAGAALMTPPFRLQVFVEPGDGIALLVDDLAGSGLGVPGVLGPEASARAFADAWTAVRAVTARTRRRLRTFELTSVTPAPATAGAMRPADSRDVPFVRTWYAAFEAESNSSVGEARAAALGERAVQAGRVFFWNHREPVSQAAIVGTTPRGVRIGMVYTPPVHRGRGYATALVAALSQRCLSDGATFCFLFTDLANEVSNAIYPKVGYRPVADFEEADFLAI